MCQPLNLHQFWGWTWSTASLDLVHHLFGPGPHAAAVLTARMPRMGFLCQHGKEIAPKRQKRCRVGTGIGLRGVLRVNTARTFANAVANDYLCALNYA